MTSNIKDYSTTQANNTSLNGISVAEGMLPSNLNNAIRALMKNTRDWFNDAQWVEYGDGSGSFTATYVSATSFKIEGSDVTSIYHAGRRLKIIASTPGTIFGTITSSSFSTDTTIVVSFDSGSLSNEAISNVYIGALSKTNDSIPTGISATKIADGSISDAEFQRLNGVTSDIQTQIDAKNATITGAASTIATSDLTASRALQSNGSGKVEVSSVTATELGHVSGVSSAIQTQINTKLTASNNLSDVASASTARTNLGLAIGTNVQAFDAQLSDIAGLTPTDSNFVVGDGSNFVTETGATARTSLGLGSVATQNSNSIAITGGSITGLSQPSANSEVATKQYVDDLLAGIRTRVSVRVATTANIDLTQDLQNGDTIDGVTLATDNRVLVKNQTDATQNGIYDVVASGTATRPTEFDTFNELAGQLISVQEGSTQADRLFLCTSNFGGTLGADNIVYQQQNVTTLDLVQDTSPQLGGDLDVNGRDIVSTSDGNITLTPNGAGVVRLDGNVDISTGLIALKNGGSQSELRLYCESSNAHYLAIKAPPHSQFSGNVTLQLPGGTGTSGQAIVTNGSGVLSFADIAETKPTVANVSQTIAPSTATTINITGTGFVSIPQVDFVNGSTGAVTRANTVSFTNATTLSVNVTLTSGNYYVRVENPDGLAGRSTNNIITASTAPSFSTSAGSLGTIAGNFSGTVATIAGSSDSAITFSETTSVLTNASEANCSLNSSTGVITTSDFGGSSTTPTTYNFTIRITDAEGQTADRAFSLTSSFGATGGGQFN
tara:strand:- start:3 stop:2345 length:2343 start_codon:yes stop_codon:yes gene_type:complete